MKARAPSPVDGRQADPGDAICDWCGTQPAKPRGRFCSQLCRQTAFRLRQRGEPMIGPARRALTFAYADPPYVKLSRKYYRGRANYAGEVDHEKLIADMTNMVRTETWAGWALSCSSKSLRMLLPMCPDATDVCPWGKPIGVPPATYGRHTTHEIVLVFGGRKRRPGVRTFLYAPPARGGGDLPGRKPVAFAAWLFDLLGMQPGDKLMDLFPGSGVISRAWDETSRLQGRREAPGRAAAFDSRTPG